MYEGLMIMLGLKMGIFGCERDDNDDDVVVVVVDDADDASEGYHADDYPQITTGRWTTGSVSS